ncbi:hypothetical protein HH308_08095 [Gordonia sp. TBRC 11910]|uniref:EcsC family protein n=2 Tax=Gordonia asplenii TaxID=2725283 RepID=A0A848L0G0_9ACTN|nr:hypothetical protein [Gordonia asplenii]NMO01178.1 hypothetical protein [Gordonia asplenii]
MPPQVAVTAAGSILDKAQRLQAPAVAKYVASLRKSNPEATPAQIIEKLEKRYLTAVTGSGGAVGAAAAVPGIGTFTAIGAITGETALFIEASALLALAIAEVHGIEPHEQERRKALVLSVALGEEGVVALGKVVGSNGGALRRLAGGAIPGPNLAALNKTLTKKIINKYAVKKAPLIIGKLMPAGIGATIGAVGNRAMGKRVINNARQAFGPPPPFWVIDGELAPGPTGQLPHGNR